MSTITKKCKMCNKIKNITCFNKHNGTKDKLDNRCKECLKIIKKKSKENSSKPQAIDIEKIDDICRDWQGGKYLGTVFPRNDKYYYACVNGKQKIFAFSKYGKDNAEKEARKWTKKYSDEIGYTKNKYKIVFNKKGNPIYLIVQLSKNYVMLCDYDNLDIVKNNSLCVSRSAGNNAKHYSNLWNNNKLISYHKYITGYNMTDHINQYPLDNRIKNLRKTSSSENNKNRTFIHKRNIIKIDEKYKSIIIYLNPGKHFEKEEISCINNTYDEAKKWIVDESFKIDNKYLKFDTESEEYKNKIKLKEKFEKIMNKYAKGFKYCDLYNNENKIADDNLNSKNKEKEYKNSKIYEKEQIYLKFKSIDPEFKIENGFVKPGNLIEHIIFDEQSYKYCSKCDKWINVNKYAKGSKNWDQLDRRCKSCQTIIRKEARKKKKREA